jgi:hypothetical protein
LPGPGFGSSVASAGDVNGDGFGDVVIGGFPNDTWLGSFCVFLGGASGLDATPSCFTPGPAGQAVGGSVAGVGDVNGDGYGDIIVGGNHDALGGGGAYLYLGSASGIDPTPVLLSPMSGNMVTGAGDLNGDGYADVAVATTNGVASVGKVLVFLGSKSGPLTPAIELPQPSPIPGLDIQFGFGLAGGGDTNGDGYTDLVVNSVSTVYVYRGGPAGPDTSPTTTISPASTYGNMLTAAHDLDGDGYSDVVSAYAIFFGSASGLTTGVPFTVPNQDTYVVGESGVGDIDGDGLDDFVIGSVSNNDYGGAISIFPGAASGFGTSSATIDAPVGPWSFFGYSVASRSRRARSHQGS